MTVLAAHGGWDKKEGGEVRLFATKDGAVQHVFPLDRGVRTVAWSAKGTFFVAGGYGLGIHAFDVKDRKELFHLAGDRQVENLRITSDDKLLVASFGNGDIRLYDLADRKEVHQFDTVHDGGIWGMALSPNDKLLATAGKDTHVFVFDLATRKRIHDLKHPGEVNGVAFTPNSQYLATGCGDSRIRIFDAKSGERVALIKGHERGTVNDLQFTSDGKLLASSGLDGTIHLWRIRPEKPVREEGAEGPHRRGVWRRDLARRPLAGLRRLGRASEDVGPQNRRTHLDMETRVKPVGGSRAGSLGAGSDRSRTDRAA